MKSEQIPGGEAVRIPIVETVETPETLPPWRR